MPIPDRTFFNTLREFRLKFGEAKLLLIEKQIETEKTRKRFYELKNHLIEEKIYNERNKK